jgi:hypothetical protein
MQKLSLNHIVAVLGILLALAVNLFLRRIGFPDKIAWGASILSLLVVSIYWSLVKLGADDEDE